MMWLTKNPQRTTGLSSRAIMFGDIVSDAFAGLVGGLGFACSGNIGDEVAVFEPTHGSAPKYEKLEPSIVNPMAMVLSAAMLLDHVCEAEQAKRVRAAVAAVVAEGKVRSYDMMKISGGPHALSKGAASTQEITNAIISKL
jgi:isocitrate dehydrogenase (NAD+)